MSEWYADRDTLISFGSFLVDEMGFSGSEVIAVFEKPWKWTREYELLESYKGKHGSRATWPMPVWHQFDADFRGD